MIVLTEFERNLSPEDLFFKWLLDGKINYSSLSERYVAYLERRKDEFNTKSNRYATLLDQFLTYSELKNKDKWVKDKAVGTLYSYDYFNGRIDRDKILDYIIKNNINTDQKTIDYEVYNKVSQLKKR